MSDKTSRFPQTLHALITIIIMFGVGFIPPVSALTVNGMKILGILIGTIYGVTCAGMAMSIRDGCNGCIRCCTSRNNFIDWFG